MKVLNIIRLIEHRTTVSIFDEYETEICAMGSDDPLLCGYGTIDNGFDMSCNHCNYVKQETCTTEYYHGECGDVPIKLMDRTIKSLSLEGKGRKWFLKIQIKENE